MHGFLSFEWPAVQIWIFRRISNKRTKSTNDWKLCYNCPQMIHVGLHSVGTYHKKFVRQNKKIKIYFAECLEMTLGKASFVECLLCGTRQRSLFAECQPLALGKDWRLSALGRPLTALCREPPLPSVWHSANLSLPSAVLCRLFSTR
jgi:ribosomal protein S17